MQAAALALISTGKQARDRRYYARNRLKVLTRVKEYRERNAALILARNRERAAAYPELRKRHNRQNYERHRQAYISRATRWVELNRERHNGYTRKTTQRYTDELSDIYVRHKLSRDSRIPAKMWPDSLVQLKRAELKLKRLWQHPKTSQNSGTNS